MTLRAYCLIRDQPWYRRSAFVTGLRAAGYAVESQQPRAIDKEAVLVIWNRYAGNHDIALNVERAGGRVLVAENGYLGEGGGTPKFQVHPAGPQPGHYYSIARGFHNDGTRTIDGGSPERFDRLRVNLKPWRTGGEYLLVCPNRSFGVAGRMMPTDWAEHCAGRLRKAQALPVRIRAHPGNNAPKRALLDDLQGAAAVYIWSSSCGIHALIEGIPVFCDAPYWIMKGASMVAGSPVPPDRLPHFQRMAYAQWSCAEIESGEPFRHLLQ